MSSEVSYILIPHACSEMTRWLAEKAEALGVEIYPGFAASEVLYKRGAVAGIATNDLGIAKDGSRKETYARGVELRARATLLGEGCRGSLSQVRHSFPVSHLLQTNLASLEACALSEAFLRSQLLASPLMIWHTSSMAAEGRRHMQGG